MMNIRTLKLTNLGRFEELDVHLAPVEEFKSNVTVFIGNNGAGKTSILKSLATSLSWFVARVRTEKGNGSPIPEDAIQVLNTHPATEAATPYRWLLARTASGKKSTTASSLQEASQLAAFYRDQYTQNSGASFPLIAFYPVERVVLDVPLKIATGWLR